MTARNPLPMGMTPPGWPTPERMAAIMEAIRRDFERYRARRLCIFLKQGENKERQTNDRSNRHKFLPADF